MSHNINTYIGRHAAWHALGTVTGQYITWQEALEHGGLDFSVFKSQLRDGLGRAVAAWGVFRWDKADQAVNAKDKAVFLGAVGEDYKCIQHSNGFLLVDSLMKTATDAHYETAGVLGNGEVVWGLADLGLAAKVGDDVQKGYLLFSTSHDGSMAHTYRTCMTRVVCQNTLNVAIGEKTKAQFKIRHTTNAMDRLTDAHRTLEAVSTDIKSIEDKLNLLAGRKCTRESVVGLMDRLFPRKAIEGIGAPDSTRRTNIIADILKLYEVNDNNAFPEQRGSLYNLLNATTAYVDHERSSNGNGTGRAESALFGSGDKLKSQAYVYLLDAAKSADAMPARTMYVDSPAPSNGPTSLLDEILAAN